MSYGAQVIEKNHFQARRNRSKPAAMNNDTIKRRTRLLLLFMALTLAAAEMHDPSLSSV